MLLQHLPQPDEIFKLNSQFLSDPRKNKINGGIGVYLDNQGKPYVLPVVQKAIKFLTFSNFNYLPISGDPLFLDESTRLVFGNLHFLEYKEYIAKQAVVGGTNGLYIWGSMITDSEPVPKIIIGNPSWENHVNIFTRLGFHIIGYNHVDKDKKFNYEGLKKILLQHPKTSVLFHGGSAHNPTGINPSKNQWVQLKNTLKITQNKVLFDFAYMGLGDSIQIDRFPIKLFVQAKIPLSVIISYSKNMSLYQHRVGAILTVCRSTNEKEIKEKYYTNVFRIVNSNPPAFGEHIAKTILLSRYLKEEWLHNMKSMVRNLHQRRRVFARYAGKKFEHVTREKGLYSLLDIGTDQVLTLRKDYGIYLLSNGRINFGGISLRDTQKVAESVRELSYKI